MAPVRDIRGAPRHLSSALIFDAPHEQVDYPIIELETIPSISCLCDRCHTLLLEVICRYETRDTSVVRLVHSSMQFRDICPICRGARAAIMAERKKSYHNYTWEWWTRGDTEQQPSDRFEVSLYAHGGNGFLFSAFNICDEISNLPTLSEWSTFDDANVDIPLIKSWLDDCLDNHPSCRKPTVPRKLLLQGELVESDAQYVAIVDTQHSYTAADIERAQQLARKLGFEHTWIPGMNIEDAFDATLVLTSLSGLAHEGTSRFEHERDMCAQVGFQFGQYKYIWTSFWSFPFTEHEGHLASHLASRTLAITPKRSLWLCQAQHAEHSEHNHLQGSDIRRFLTGNHHDRNEQRACMDVWLWARAQRFDISKQLSARNLMGDYIDGVWDLEQWNQMAWRVHTPGERRAGPCWSWISTTSAPMPYRFRWPLGEVDRGRISCFIKPTTRQWICLAAKGPAQSRRSRRKQRMKPTSSIWWSPDTISETICDGYIPFGMNRDYPGLDWSIPQSYKLPPRFTIFCIVLNGHRRVGSALIVLPPDEIYQMLEIDDSDAIRPVISLKRQRMVEFTLS